MFNRHFSVLLIYFDPRNQTVKTTININMKKCKSYFIEQNLISKNLEFLLNSKKVAPSRLYLHGVNINLLHG